MLSGARAATTCLCGLLQCRSIGGGGRCLKKGCRQKEAADVNEGQQEMLRKFVNIEFVLPTNAVSSFIAIMSSFCLRSQLTTCINSVAAAAAVLFINL